MLKRPWTEVTIRTSPEERELFRATAQAYGLSVASWARSSLIRIARTDAQHNAMGTSEQPAQASRQ